MARTTNVREERIELTALDKTLSSGMKGAQKSVDGLRSSVDTMKNVFATLAGGGAVGLFTRALVTHSVQGEQAANRLTAALKATGYQAGISQREIEEMADSIQDSLGFDDEGVKNAASNLIKFGNIHGDVFREALKLSADLAAFMGTDMPEAAQMLGKSLQSPTEGLMMMERNFGKLTDAEEKHIENLVRQGKAVEAQNAVLDLWRKKIGGTAELMNTGLTKATRDLKNAWDDLLQEMGKTDQIGGQVERSLGGLSNLLKDLRKELEGERTPLSTLIIDLANAFAYWQTLGLAGNVGGEQAAHNIFGSIPTPKIGSRAPMDEATRLRKWADDFRAQQAQWLAGPVKLGGSVKKEKEDSSAADLARSLEMQQAILDEANALGVKFLQNQDKLIEEHNRRLEEAGTRGWIAHAEAVQEAADNMIYAWDKFGNRLEVTKERWKEMQDEAEKTNDWAREMGLTFSSAFEDAIVGGKGLREILKGISQDIARIIVRKNITEPAGNAITEFVKGINWGELFKMEQGGVMTSAGPMPLQRYAGGGIADSPQVAMFGEGSTPEAFVPLPDGRRIPVQISGVGDGSTTNNFYRVRGGRGGDVRSTRNTFFIDARGADSTGLARLAAAVRRLDGSIEYRSVAAVFNAQLRGRRV